MYKDCCGVTYEIVPNILKSLARLLCEIPKLTHDIFTQASHDEALLRTIRAGMLMILCRRTKCPPLRGQPNGAGQVFDTAALLNDSIAQRQH